MSDDTRRRLDRAPGERYRGAAGSPASPPTAGAGSAAGAGVAVGRTPPAARGSLARSALAGLAVAAGCGIVLAVVGSFDTGLGLLAVSAFTGWAGALALIWGGGAAWPGRGRGAAAAALLGIVAVLFGLGLLWAWSRTEGGVLGPVDYLDERFGVLAFAFPVVAAVVGGLRGR